MMPIRNPRIMGHKIKITIFEIQNEINAIISSGLRPNLNYIPGHPKKILENLYL
jgi:hypothetical protein